MLANIEGHIWFYLLFTLLSLDVGAAVACSKKAGALEESINSSNLIFDGIVIKSEINDFYNEKNTKHGAILVEFKVMNAYRGNASSIVRLFTGTGGADCGVPVTVYDRYIVFASKNKYGKYVTSITHGTRLWNSEDASVLKAVFGHKRRIIR